MRVGSLSLEEAALGVVTFVVFSVGSLWIAARILLALPPTYFAIDRRRDPRIDRHPLLRMARSAAKNLIGIAVVCCGIVLSLPGVPGPGLLTILIGITLVDFPGKRRLEKRFVSHPRIREPLNRWRARHGRTPFVFDDRPPPTDGGRG